MKDIPRRRAAFLARREDALGRASAGLWECRLRDEALEWTNGIYDLFDIPRGGACIGHRFSNCMSRPHAVC